MRKRIIKSHYELAQICVPSEVADFIISKNQYLCDGESREVYEELKAAKYFSKSYEESERMQYLIDLFWVMGDAKATVVRVGEQESVPTCYLEREVSSFGFHKVQPCVALSLRVAWDGEHRRQLYESMKNVVEGKMRSFKTDFYFHDMMTMSRYALHHPLLWTVGTSHTFTEVFDSVAQAERWANAMVEHGDSVRRFLNGYDDTWMGSALRVSCSDSDLYFYHDGAQLHDVSRKTFQDIHDRHVERVRKIVSENIGRNKAA